MSDQGQHEVVIVGGGVAALEGLLAVREYGGDRTHMTLIAPGAEFMYRPVVVGEPFGRPAAATYDLQRIADDRGATFLRDALKWVDPDKRMVHTEQGASLSYDSLLLATGARMYPRFDAAITIDPAIMDEQLHGIVQDIEGGYVHSVAFVIPTYNTWPLPLYELALMTARRAYEMGVEVEVSVVTPEDSPLAIFGVQASAMVRGLLDDAGVRMYTDSYTTMPAAGTLHLHEHEQDLVADRVIALPELHGPAVPGIPRSATHGFIAIDAHCRVVGLENVYAAGDLADYPIKQGGVAAQEADTAAQAIAAAAGAPVTPEPLHVTLHAILWGGPKPLYIRAHAAGLHGTGSEVSTTPLWTPPAKIHARLLGPYLEGLDTADSTR